MEIARRKTCSQDNLLHRGLPRQGEKVHPRWQKIVVCKTFPLCGKDSQIAVYLLRFGLLSKEFPAQQETDQAADE
jgi:hypothetical protein